MVLDTSSLIEYCKNFKQKQILISYFLEIWRYVSIKEDSEAIKSLDAIKYS
jgi:hypothetical protein